METGYVYFIETKCGRFVKIGYSVNPFRRISELGTLRPSAFDAHILGYLPGTVATEQWLHGMFTADRDNGEWFRLTPRLERFIDTLGIIIPPVKGTPMLRPAPPKPIRKTCGSQRGRGRPVVMRTCPACGREFLGRQMLGHDCKKRGKAA